MSSESSYCFQLPPASWDDKMPGLEMPSVKHLSLIIVMLCQLVPTYSATATTNAVEYECKGFCLLGAKGEQGSF
jgi:hypothetical protein